ncbi:hypothetical protein HK096_006149, partial [Nowakowskiella sp. JEL0078]
MQLFADSSIPSTPNAEHPLYSFKSSNDNLSFQPSLFPTNNLKFSQNLDSPTSSLIETTDTIKFDLLRKRKHSQEIGELHLRLYSLAALFTALTLFGIFIFGQLQSRYGARTANSLPAILYLFFLLITALPFNVLFWRERMMLLSSLSRTMFGGLQSKVPFSDVILADILTSFSRVIGDLQIVVVDFVYNTNLPKLKLESSKIPLIKRAIDVLNDDLPEPNDLKWSDWTLHIII